MTGWRPDGTGITQSSDSRAEDQAGDFHIVRFRHPGLPNAVVTCKSYAYAGRPRGPRCLLRRDRDRTPHLRRSGPARRDRDLARHRARLRGRHLAHPGRGGRSGPGTAEAWLRSAEPTDWDGQPY